MSENSISFLGNFFGKEDDEPADCNPRLDTRSTSGDGERSEFFSLLMKKTITSFHNFHEAFFSSVSRKDCL